MSDWDWDATTLKDAPAFLEETGAACLDTIHGESYRLKDKRRAGTFSTKIIDARQKS